MHWASNEDKPPTVALGRRRVPVAPPTDYSLQPNTHLGPSVASSTPLRGINHRSMYTLRRNTPPIRRRISRQKNWPSVARSAGLGATHEARRQRKLTERGLAFSGYFCRAAVNDRGGIPRDKFVEMTAVR